MTIRDSNRISRLRDKLAQSDAKVIAARNARTAAQRALESEALRQARAALAKAGVTERRSIVRVNDDWRANKLKSDAVLLMSMSAQASLMNGEDWWCFRLWFVRIRKDGRPFNAMSDDHYFHVKEIADLTKEVTWLRDLEVSA